MNKKKRIGLIDGDIVAYKAAVVCEKGIKIDDQTWTLSANEEDVFRFIDDHISKLKKMLKLDGVIVCLSGTDNFRKTLSPDEYKANRTQRPPLLREVADKYLAYNYTSDREDMLEADDLLGIYATNPKYKDVEFIVVTEDKDLLQIPTLVYYPSKNKLLKVTPERAERFRFIQTLTGDVADNYKGCSKVGVTNAEKIVDGTHKKYKKEGSTMYSRVRQAFLDSKHTEEYFLLNLQMATILHFSNYDKETKQITGNTLARINE